MTYLEYTGLGFSLVSENEFEKYEREASQFLDYYTQGRCSDNHCLGELIDNYKARDVELDKFSGRIKSESVLDHSVTLMETDPNSLKKEYTANATAIIRRYCWSTGALYRGV